MTKDAAFQSPVRKYVNCFAKSSEWLWAHNSILETRFNALREVNTQRKLRETGARAVLKGKHIVTGGNILEMVENAQRVS